MKVILAHLLASAQLAEMAYNADPVDHKREAWEKAKTAHEEAAEAERLADQASISQLGRPVKDLDTLLKDSAPYKELEKHAATLAEAANRLTSENGELHSSKLALAEENARLKESNSFLNSQLIEKSQKIDELEKSALSGKSTVPATTPEPTPEATAAAVEALTPYQKGLQTKAANQAKAAEEAAKKNS